MATVYLPERVAHLVGDARIQDVDAPDYRSLMAVLEGRFPGVRAVLEREHAVVLDGDIIDAPLLEPIEAVTEVHFITRLGGG